MASGSSLSFKAIIYLIPFFYFIFFSYFTGSLQIFETPPLGIEGIKILFVNFKSTTYSGPGFEVITEGLIIFLRLFPLLMGLVLSYLLYLNLSLILKLKSKGLLRTCLLGSTSSFLATISSVSYLCCGLAPSIILLGSSTLAYLGFLPSLIAISLLTLNLVILKRRSLILKTSSSY
ncbi:hypothetical protein HRbin06_00605 [archaeon HR06]|nr:hypothetical protein HRbin06_00605 [archaeon HR06]